MGTASELLDARKALQRILDDRAKRFLFFRKKIYYESGNKTGKYLAKALREHIHSNTILGIKGANNKLDVSNEAIAEHFHSYYKALYNLPQQHRPPGMVGNRSQVIQDFLIKSGLPILDTTDTGVLEDKITPSEIQEVIKKLKTGKSPGPDGFTAIYYRSLPDILSEPLAKALNSLSNQREVTPDWLSAHITVLPKPNKDPTECTRYRPISLLYLDVNFFSKIIANRLTPLLQSLIGPEQVGFMPGREARDNIIKAMLLIHAADPLDIKGLLLSTDAEKAFDRVAWDYMLATCSHIGLGPKMLTWISSLYQNPTARLKINGTLSGKVHISNGTRQGYPLSPLLFILSLEPFIRTVNAESAINGFRVKDREYKVSAFVDDLLFFLVNPHTTIPNLISKFTQFGYVSNLKINYAKSEAMNIKSRPKSGLPAGVKPCEFTPAAQCEPGQIINV